MTLVGQTIVYLFLVSKLSAMHFLKHLSGRRLLQYNKQEAKSLQNLWGIFLYMNINSIAFSVFIKENIGNLYITHYILLSLSLQRVQLTAHRCLARTRSRSKNLCSYNWWKTFWWVSGFNNYLYSVINGMCC